MTIGAMGSYYDGTPVQDLPESVELDLLDCLMLGSEGLLAADEAQVDPGALRRVNTCLTGIIARLESILRTDEDES